MGEIMKFRNIIATTFLAFSTAAAPALASGPVTVVDTPVVVVPTPVLSWTGFYAGAYVGQEPEVTGDSFIGLRAGYNYQAGRFVVGGELDALRYSAGGDTEAFVNLRGGYLISDNLLAFLSVGRGHWSGGSDLNSVGLGVEYRTSGPMSVRFDYEGHNVAGANVFNGRRFVKLGVSWNF
jgi:outer membrane immunogenic protein